MSKKKWRKNQKKESHEAAPTVLPVVKKLQSSEASERAWAATSISNLSQENYLQELLNSGVVLALLNALEDESYRVVLESFGALRNLLVYGGQPAADKLCEDDGIMKLINIIFRIEQKQKEPITLIKDKDDEVPDFHAILEQALHCTWCLVETSGLAVKAFSTLEMIQLASHLFVNSDIPIPLRKVSGQFLNTISDDNDLIYQYFTPDIVKCVFTVLNDTTLRTLEDCLIELSVLSGSILHNIKVVISDSELAEMYKTIMSILSIAISIDSQTMVKCAYEAGLSIEKVVCDNSNQTEDARKIGDLELVTPQNNDTNYLMTANQILSVAQLSLELIANIYSQDLRDDDDELDDQDFEFMDCEQVESNDMDEMGLFLFNAERPLIESVLNLCKIHDYRLHVAACQPFVINMEKVQTRALACLGNIFLVGAVDAWAASNQTALKEIWGSLFQHAISLSNLVPIPLELFDNILSCLWCISRCLINCKIKLCVQQDIIQFLLKGASQSISAPESMKIKIIGILTYIARFSGSVQLNKIIGEWIFEQLDHITNTDGDFGADIMAELLNSIYDIYADGSFEYDEPVFVTSGFLQKLRNISPNVSIKVKSVKQRSIKERCQEAKLNLVEFIKYKQSEGK